MNVGESRVCRCRQDAGASPLFPPVDAPQDLELAVADLSETVHQSPECFGLSRSRWWLGFAAASGALAGPFEPAWHLATA